MHSTLLTRRQIFLLIKCNNTNFSMDYHVPVQRKRPIVKYNNDTAILPNKQQFRSFRHSRHLLNAPGNNNSNDSINLNDLWAAKPTMGKQNERNKPTNGDWWTTQSKKRQDETVKRDDPRSGGDSWRTTQKKDMEPKQHHQLASKSIRYGQMPPKWLQVQYWMGRNGHKSLAIYKNGFLAKASKFATIWVPSDVFAFVRAMDEVLNAVEVNKDKIIEARPNHNRQEILLYTAKAKGFANDFELDLRLLGPYLSVRMRSVPNERGPRHRPKYINVPFRIFCWLRQAIGEVFMENGEPEVQQQFGEPPSLPDWLIREVLFMSPSQGNS